MGSRIPEVGQQYGCRLKLGAFQVCIQWGCSGVTTEQEQHEHWSRRDGKEKQ